MNKLLMLAFACTYGFALYSMNDNHSEDQEYAGQALAQQKSERRSALRKIKRDQITAELEKAYQTYKKNIENGCANRLETAVEETKSRNLYLTSLQKNRLLAKAMAQHEIHKNRLLLSLTVKWVDADDQMLDEQSKYADAVMTEDQRETVKKIHYGKLHQKQYEARPNPQIIKEFKKASLNLLLIQNLKTM